MRTWNVRVSAGAPSLRRRESAPGGRRRSARAKYELRAVAGEDDDGVGLIRSQTAQRTSPPSPPLTSFFRRDEWWPELAMVRMAAAVVASAAVRFGKCH